MYFIHIYYFCTQNWFWCGLSPHRIKRESGENPGQSRCCEAHYAPWHILIATDYLCKKESGRRQGESQSEDLPFIKGRVRLVG